MDLNKCTCEKPDVVNRFNRCDNCGLIKQEQTPEPQAARSPQPGDQGYSQIGRYMKPEEIAPRACWDISHSKDKTEFWINFPDGKGRPLVGIELDLAKENLKLAKELAEVKEEYKEYLASVNRDALFKLCQRQQAKLTLIEQERDRLKEALEISDSNKKRAQRFCEIYEKALSFYADEDNWSEANAQTCPAIINGEDIESRTDNKCRFTGGKRAREALKGKGL